MKIQLKIPTHTLALLGVLSERINKSKATTRREKITLSIAQDVADKLLAKAYKAMRVNDFNKNSLKTITLKIHEADILEHLLKMELADTNDVFITNCFRILINELNQKLA